MKVAVRGSDHKLRWLSWELLPQLQWYKKLYKTNPCEFTETDGVLYKKSSSKESSEKVRTLLNSCLKISGTTYALALTLCEGDRHSATFYKTLEVLTTRVFKDKTSWIEVFEDHIKDYGIRVANIDDVATHWIDSEDECALKPSVLKSYLCTKPEMFERVGTLLFLLPTQNILLENMFFRCVELAGSEYALATTLSTDKLTQERHLKNFERMSFKHAENFKTYSKLFSDFLERTHTLFEEEIIYA